VELAPKKLEERILMSFQFIFLYKNTFNGISFGKLIEIYFN